MDVFFLSANKPIAKRYELDKSSNQIIKHSYPFVYEVSSFAEAPKDLNDFANLLQTYSATGSTLLKGKLSRPLKNESRKGSTNPDEKTDWICLDVDGIEGYADVDEFLTDIGCGDVDYVVQWSSSMGIENSMGFRCHIFMQLTKAHHPQILKYWLMDINLSTPKIASQLDLTKTGNSLLWPLDISTCQNDKLLYVAPPILGPGITDPFPGNKRIKFVKKKLRKLTLPSKIPTKDAIRDRTDKKVTELRKLSNLPDKKKVKYKYSGAIEYMVNPDSATITEMKVERGFVYFNLNGGDSWAYFHPEDQPMYIHNFKGEPSYRTEDLLPDYWAQLQQKAAACVPNPQGIIYLAFRDFRTSNYYNGSYDANTNVLNLAQAKNETQLRHFMKQHGQVVGDYIPDWKIVWNPHSNTVVDPVTRELNTFQPSDFFMQSSVSAVKKIPPTIYKVIDHVLGHDQPTIDHFINWLAVVTQNLTVSGTAWVWQGTQGTGKGVLFHHILSPLFGDHNVVSKRMEELQSEFTGFMENKFLVFIDEIEAGRSLYHGKITAKLKNLIVEPMISIRQMYVGSYMAVNYANMIFASNKSAPIEVAPDDRRFNVGPYQLQPIQLTAQEINQFIPSELEDFYAYLMTMKADPVKARTPLINSARSTLIDINRTALDTVIDALMAGNLEFLWDHLHSNPSALNPMDNMRYQPFRALIIELVKTLEPKLTRDDLYVILDWCIGDMPRSPHKLTALLKHHRVHMTQVWKHGRNTRGIDVIWNPDKTWLAQCQQEILSGAV